MASSRRRAVDRHLLWLHAKLQASATTNIERGLLAHAAALIAIAHIVHKMATTPRRSQDYTAILKRWHAEPDAPGLREAHRDIIGVAQGVDNLFLARSGLAARFHNWPPFHMLPPRERFEHEFLDLHGTYSDGSLPPSELRRIREEEQAAKAAARAQRKTKPKAKSQKRPAPKTAAPTRRKPPTKRELAEQRRTNVAKRKAAKAARATAPTASGATNAGP